MDQTRAPCRSVSFIRLTVNKGCVPVPARAILCLQRWQKAWHRAGMWSKGNAPRHWENVCPVMRVRVLKWVHGVEVGAERAHTHTRAVMALRLPLQWGLRRWEGLN